MSIVTRVCLVACLAASLSACSQPKPVDTGKVKEAMRCFGREEYGKVPLLLEESGAMNSPQAPMFYFYVGECFYQTNDLANAQHYFEKAFQTIFNKDETAWRLIAIHEKQNRHDVAVKYQEYWKRKRETYDSYMPDAKWLNAQPKGKRNFDDVIMPTGSGNTVEGKYNWGRFYLFENIPSVAVWQFECGLRRYIPLEDRFNSEWALRYYQKLSKAYRQKAKLFELNKFCLDGYEEKRKQEAAATIRKYLDEHRAQEIPEAEQLAEHYRLKAIVVEARLAAKKTP